MLNNKDKNFFDLILCEACGCFWLQILRLGDEISFSWRLVVWIVLEMVLIKNDYVGVFRNTVLWSV